MHSRALVSICLLFAAVDTASSAAPVDDPVVVRVGSSEVRGSELRFLLGRLHEFERQSYGKTPDEVRRAFVERRLVPELLFAEEARRLGARQNPLVSRKISDVLAHALTEDLERTIDAKLTRSELTSFCQRSVSGADACMDLAGYRVVLRRQRAREEVERLSRELREQKLAKLDYALLGRLPATREDASAAPTASQRQP